MMEKFKTWRDIRDRAREKGFENLAKRMELNNRCWMSSGEFGRNQVMICDSIRFADDEEDAMQIAEQLDAEMRENYGLY